MDESDPQCRPSELILQAIARHKGRDPVDLDFLLYDYVDADALDRLIEHAQSLGDVGELEIELIVADYDVTVSASNVEVRHRAATQTSPVAPTVQPGLYGTGLGD